MQKIFDQLRIDTGSFAYITGRQSSEHSSESTQNRRLSRLRITDNATDTRIIEVIGR